MKYKIRILFLALLLALLLASVFFIIAYTGSTKSSYAAINFNRNAGEIKIDYGANEDDNWMAFANSSQIGALHRNVNSRYLRVWVSSQWYRESTVPLKAGGAYDFSNLDRFINAVLKIDAIPFVVFAHAPGTYGEGNGEDPPANDAQFADYVEQVVQHYRDACQSSRLAKPCNVNEWYFEIWNEPYTKIWWEGNPPRYVSLFNAVYPRIKDIAPDAKVGGFGAWFLRGTNTDRLKKFLKGSRMDFISIHHYGNILNKHAGEEEKMSDVKFIHYDLILSLRSLISRYKPGQEVEIIEGEYSSDYTSGYMPHLDEKFTAAWYASALIWQIKSQEVSAELFYAGTSLHKDKGFGMWSNELDLWPVYFMKESFVKYNKKGSSVFETEYPEGLFDVLAVENDGGKFITIVNKQNKNSLINITFTGGNFSNAVDLGYSEKDVQGSIFKYAISNGKLEVSLQPYEVKFMQVN